jgi:hypothetical protein
LIPHIIYATTMTPADRARKILLGTGMCLMFVFAVGLSQGRYSLDFDIGLVFPFIGILLISMGVMQGSLGQRFPDESDDEMTRRVQGDVEETEREKNVGQAWASLEHHVLKSKLDESE